MPPMGKRGTTTPRRTTRTTQPAIGEVHFIPAGIGDPNLYAYLASNDLKAHGEALATQRGVGLVGGVAMLEGGAPVARVPGGGGAGETGAAHGGEAGRPDLEAERNRIREEERQRAQNEANQRLQEVVRQAVEEAVRPLNEQIEGLNTRVGELEQERDQLQQQLQERDEEIARLNARIQELEAGGGGGGADGHDLEPLSAEELEELNNQLHTNHNELIDLTIRRKRTSIFTRWLPRQRRERQQYDNLLTQRSQLMERMVNHRRAEMHRDHPEMSQEQIYEDQHQFMANDLNQLAQDEHTEHERRLQVEIDSGGIRGRWAQIKRFWANRRWYEKLGLALVPAGALALISATAGAGLFVLAAGGAAKFAVGIINNNASIRNVAPAKLHREQRRINRDWQNAQRQLASLAIGARYEQLPGVYQASHRANMSSAEHLNTLGRVGQFAGGVILSLSAAGVEVTPSILDAVRGGGHHNVTPGNPPGTGGNQPPTGPPSPGQPGTPGQGESLDVGPKAVSPKELANTHIEFVPDGNGGTIDTTAVRLEDGYHLEYAGHDANGNFMVDIENPRGDIIADDVGFTRTGAMANSSILDSNMYHGPNQYFKMHAPYDKLYGDPEHWSKRTISTLLIKDED